MKLFRYFIVIFFLFPDVALAHRFIMAAWIEGEQIFVEAAFNDGSLARGATIKIFDADGTEPLVVGRTDEQGQYSCAIPKNTALRVWGDAGMGHQGEELLSKEDVTAAFVTTPLKAAAKPAVSVVASLQPSSQASQREADSQLVAMDPAALSRVVEAAVEKKLRPIVRQLATAEQHRGIDIRDIFSGLGYILGLVGLGTYLGYRRRKR